MATKDTTPDPSPCIYHAPVEGFVPDAVSIPWDGKPHVWVVRCPYCHAQGPTALFFDDAVRMWNIGYDKACEPVNDPAAMLLQITDEEE